MRQKLTLVFCAVVAVIATCGTLCSTVAVPASPPVVAPPGSYAGYAIPFSTTPHGQIVVQTQIDGRPAGTFLVDTGSANLITDTLVTKFALKPLPFPSDQTPRWDGKPTTLISPNLQVGSLTLKGSAYIVIDQATARRLTTIAGQPVDGVIGTQILRHLAAEIDPFTHQITVVMPGALSDAAVRQLGFAGASVAPLLPTLDGKTLGDTGKLAVDPNTFWNLGYRVSAQIGDGKRVVMESMELDTGAAGTVFGPEVAAGLKLDTVKVSAGQALEGLRSTDKVQVPSLQIGDLRWADLPAWCYQDGKGQFVPLLGMDVLSGHRVLLDFPGAKMYVALPLLAVKVQAAPSGPSPGAAAAKGAVRDPTRTAPPTSATP